MGSSELGVASSPEPGPLPTAVAGAPLGQASGTAGIPSTKGGREIVPHSRSLILRVDQHFVDSIRLLVPFMPLPGNILLAVVVVLVARLWFRHRESRGDSSLQVHELDARVEGLRLGHSELPEGAEFAGCLLGQVKEGQRLTP